MPDLTHSMLSILELFLIEIIVLLPERLSLFFVALHDAPHVWLPRQDHVYCFWVEIDTRK